MTKDIQISHFCFSNPKESNNYTQVYLAEPEKKFLEKFGRLSILINFGFKKEPDNQKLAWAKKWSQNLIDLIKNDFYNPLRTVVEIEKDFEDSLQKINDWLQREKSEQSEIFEEFLADFDVDIVLLKNDNVYFSQTGEIRTNLIQDDKLIDLVEDKNKSGKFLNIISGKLEDDSLLFFATKNLFDYFSSQKIIQTFKAPVLKIETELKNLLTEEIDKITLSGLIISGLKEVPKEELSKIIPEPEKKSKEKKILKLNLETKKEKLEPKPKVDKTEKKSAIEKTSLMEMKPSKKEKLQKIKHNPPELPIMKTGRLTYSRKTMLIISVILALLLIQSIIILGQQQKKNRLAQQYTQILEALRTKEDELSLALIYQDQVKIKELLDELKNLLNQLPQKTEEQKENYNLFQDKYVQQVNKFYHLITLNDLSPLLDLSEKYENIQTGGLTNIGNDFYIFDPNNNYIYLFNIETKKLELVNQASANVGRLEKISFLDNDNLIGIDQNQGLATFNTIDKELLPLKLAGEKIPQNIQDFCIYGQRLYTFEPLENQIHKHQKTIDGFGVEQPWLQEQVDITDGLTSTIDGSIYILKKTGQILKFYQGKKIEFNLDEIQPSLSLIDPNVSPLMGKIKLFTSDELNYLYLLDGPTKRLIILSKQGGLIKQFTSPLFEDLKDFIISRKENKAWLLSGTKIFEIEIE